jgi:hypothetical protein
VEPIPLYANTPLAVDNRIQLVEACPKELIVPQEFAIRMEAVPVHRFALTAETNALTSPAILLGRLERMETRHNPVQPLDADTAPKSGSSATILMNDAQTITEPFNAGQATPLLVANNWEPIWAPRLPD